MSLDVCLASLAPSTVRQYSSGLKIWWEFCSSARVNPFQSSASQILEFLTLQFNKGASYSSLNTYRSAIAQVVGPEVSQDFRLQKFFKGVYMLRPGLPKYENTWDPAQVLNYLKQFDNSCINLKILTQKVVTLLALATGQRLQTLAHIEINNIIRSEGIIEIPIPKRVKTSARSRSQPFLRLPFLDSDPDICVARALLAYLEKTKNLRGIEQSLFISTKPPHKKVSTQTLSRWIKVILSKSGINVQKFSAYSTRHASTSAAARKGLNFDSIRLAAGWSKDSKMFATVYNRPLNAAVSFAETVLTC